jgi:histidinol-phosphatase (PHP family)
LYLVDYHCHSDYSFDSKAKLEDVVKSAIKKGLKELCITDHFDYGTEEYTEIDYEAYMKEFLELKEKYKNKIKFLFGIEVGIQSEHVQTVQKILKGIDFDFKIASTHDVGNIGPHLDKYWQDLSRVEGYRKYYKGMYDSISSYSDFDIFGHLDYIVRYGPYKNIGFEYNEVGDILDESMKMLIEKDKGIEINTSSLRKGMKEFHPNDIILKRYIELGGEIFTIGSDAHIPEDVGMDVDKAIQKLQYLGIKYLATYENRKLIMKKI